MRYISLEDLERIFKTYLSPSQGTKMYLPVLEEMGDSIKKAIKTDQEIVLDYLKKCNECK